MHEIVTVTFILIFFWLMWYIDQHTLYDQELVSLSSLLLVSMLHWHNAFNNHNNIVDSIAFISGTYLHIHQGIYPSPYMSTKYMAYVCNLVGIFVSGTHGH